MSIFLKHKNLIIKRLSVTFFLLVLGSVLLSGIFTVNTFFKASAMQPDYTLNVYTATGATQGGGGGTVSINGGNQSLNESAVISAASSTTIEAFVNEGHEFTGWYSAIIGGLLITRNESHTFSMPSSNTTYYAIFTPFKYTVNVTSYPSGSGNLSGAGSHDHGSAVNLTATPISPNYQFYRWTKDGLEVSTNPNYSFTIYENAVLVAEFKVKITVNAVGNGTAIIGTSGNLTEGYFLPGDGLTLTATPDVGHEFYSWSGAITSTNTQINIIVGNSVAIYNASFQVEGASLTVTATYGGNTLGSSVNQNYAENDLLTLVANADLGYHFVAWQGVVSGPFNATQSTTSYRVTADDVSRGSISLTALFAKDNVTLTAYAVTNGVLGSLGGTVAVNGNTYSEKESLLMPPGTNVTLNASASSGYSFVGWYTEADATYLVTTNYDFNFDMLSMDTYYFAVFEASYWTQFASQPYGMGILASPYIISTPEELAWVAKQTNNNSSWSDNVYIQLANNIDLTGHIWKPIGDNSSGNSNTRFMGNFDGRGNVITNVLIENQADNITYNGLFGYLYGADTVVKNLGLINLQLNLVASLNSYAGGLVGQVEASQISNCYSYNGNINVILNGNAYAYVGGLVGNNVSGQIENCYNNGNLFVNNLRQDASYVGGIVGSNYGNGADCLNSYYVGAIAIDQQNGGMPSQYVGAIIGYNSLGATVMNCLYNADLTFLNAVGVNNSNDYYNYAKTTLQLKDLTTYEEIDNPWNFDEIWVEGHEEHTGGYPAISGVGNLTVTTVASTIGGTIEPYGTFRHYEGEDEVMYFIVPEDGYVIDLVKINSATTRQFQGLSAPQAYVFNHLSGQKTIDASFKEKSTLPKNFFLFIVVGGVFALFLLIILRKVFKRATRRSRMIRGGLRKYRRKK